VNGRLIEFSQGVSGKKPKHIWRDSLAIIPVGLAEYQKTEIDYSMFVPTKRDKPKIRPIIEAYLRDDCVFLYEIVSKFRERFTDENGSVAITVGQAAMREFVKFHDYERATEQTDEIMREYYFGGRTQCFASGILPGPWKVFDVNSSYPAAMRNFQHPLTDIWDERDKPPAATYKGVWFAEVEGTNFDAIPLFDAEVERTEFNTGSGIFRACSHELVPAIKAGLFKPDRWHKVLVPERHGNFAEFVDYWYAEKVRCKAAGDVGGELFAKFMLNSCYGKLGANPRKYRDYALLRDVFADAKLTAFDLLKQKVGLATSGWQVETTLRTDPYLELWSKPSPVFGRSFNNVGIAASITSASRSIMLRGLQDAIEPIYCDTDSVICRDFRGDVSDTVLGAWKAEGWAPKGERKRAIVADYCAIAGRKTYCLYNKEGRRIVPMKWASKGGDLSPEQIIDIAAGGEVQDKINEAPTFSIKSSPRYVKRTFRRTVDNRVKAFVN
jgi:hypothetical protein